MQGCNLFLIKTQFSVQAHYTWECVTGCISLGSKQQFQAQRSSSLEGWCMMQSYLSLVTLRPAAVICIWHKNNSIFNAMRGKNCLSVWENYILSFNLDVSFLALFSDIYSDRPLLQDILFHSVCINLHRSFMKFKIRVLRTLKHRIWLWHSHTFLTAIKYNFTLIEAHNAVSAPFISFKEQRQILHLKPKIEDSRDPLLPLWLISTTWWSQLCASAHRAVYCLPRFLIGFHIWIEHYPLPLTCQSVNYTLTGG